MSRFPPWEKNKNPRREECSRVYHRGTPSDRKRSLLVSTKFMAEELGCEIEGPNYSIVDTNRLSSSTRLREALAHTILIIVVWTCYYPRRNLVASTLFVLSGMPGFRACYRLLRPVSRTQQVLGGESGSFARFKHRVLREWFAIPVVAQKNDKPQFYQRNNLHAIDDNIQQTAFAIAGSMPFGYLCHKSSRIDRSRIICHRRCRQNAANRSLRTCSFESLPSIIRPNRTSNNRSCRCPRRYIRFSREVSLACKRSCAWPKKTWHK